jgi:hypothetical protein
VSDVAPTPTSVRPSGWASLRAATRCLLIAVYFAEGLGLASLASFFAEASWPVRTGIAAACLAPIGLLNFARPDLRIYLPGPLLTLFGLFIGMLPGGRNELRRFKRMLKEANLPEIAWHDLRHTAASLALSQNVHPKIVQEMLGHSKIQTTMDTYSHLMPTMGAAAAEAIAAAIADAN